MKKTHIFKRFDRAFEKSLKLSIENHPKLVLMSDCHRGTGTWADNFLNNRPIYTAALKHYLKNGYTYIELGDGDELWENRSFQAIYKTHKEIYDLFYEFDREERLFMLYGNHDRIKENSYYMRKGLDKVIPFYESITLVGDASNFTPIYMFHGYQGDLINDQFWKISRWLVRYLWKPLEVSGFKDPTSAAKNYSKARKKEENFIEYSCKRNCILISGHTHRPSLMKESCGMYFNTGSCVHPYSITAIELTSNTATLVKWTMCSNSDLSLHVCKEILNFLKW